MNIKKSLASLVLASSLSLGISDKSVAEIIYTDIPDKVADYYWQEDESPERGHWEINPADITIKNTPFTFSHKIIHVGPELDAPYAATLSGEKIASYPYLYDGIFYEFSKMFSFEEIINENNGFTNKANLFSDGMYLRNIEWIGQKSKYLGVRISDLDKIHYGWIGLSVTGDFGNKITIHDYAYDTIPGKEIPAGIPEPSTFGLLGIAGLMGILRKQKKFNFPTSE